MRDLKEAIAEIVTQTWCEPQGRQDREGEVSAITEAQYPFRKPDQVQEVGGQ